MSQLTEKVVLITGGGRGIGAATALRLANEGAYVLVNDLDETATQVAQRIAASGGKCESLVADLSLPETPAHLVEQAWERYGTLDILVHCAGFPADGLLETMNERQWSSVLDIHLSVLFRLAQALWPRWQRQVLLARQQQQALSPRKLIAISSVAARFGNAGQANYAAAKAGTEGLIRTLAREGGPYNILANIVCFGSIETRLTAVKEGKCENRPGLSLTQHRRLATQTALRRIGTVEEASGAIYFLASDDSNYVTGHILEVSGGQLGLF